MRKKNIALMCSAAISFSTIMSFFTIPSTVFAEAQQEADTEAENPEKAETEAPEEAETEAPEEAETEASDAAETEASDEEELPGVEQVEEDIVDDVSKASVTSKEVPFYFGDLDVVFDYPLYFIDDVMDIPYFNISDWANLMVSLLSDNQERYQLEIETDGDLALLTRENGFSMLIEFGESKILFDDYDGFIHGPGESSLLDVVSDQYTDDNGDPVLIDKIEKGSFDRYGKQIELDLGAYNIPLYWSEEDGLYLVPMQTLSDFLISPSTGRSFLFNTEAVYFANDSDLGCKSEEYTPLGKSYYYSVKSHEMSEELAWYSYCELCLMLDNLYGRKDTHDISSFDSLFTEIGYKEDLLSTDPDVKDGALIDFIKYYLDDLHSGFCGVSYLTDTAQTIEGTSLSGLKDNEVYETYNNARNNADHQIAPYEEYGNTAYITFDHFWFNKAASDYYEGGIEIEEDPASDYLDTVALVIYAHEQITRENSPIENVVIDLSLNGGGQADAAAIISAWYLGEASMSIRSQFTGAISTGTYRFDANLDGVFDDNDTVKDKNLYCLIGPYSFSCGNLVPNIFRSSGKVTLIGKESGGGSCSVLHISSAHGAMFDISSPNRMSYQKNGSFYDTDLGISPDCVIVRPESFYDRDGLTEYISNLF